MFAFTNRQIEIFLSVCETGSIRHTADLLRLSEAAVSQHIRTLETQLGIALFERRRGARSALSDDGIAFRRGALEFVEVGNRLAAPRPHQGRAPVHLKIFADPVIFEHYVRPAFPQFVERNPDVNITFVTDVPLTSLPEALARGRLHGALCAVRTERDLPRSVLLSRAKCGIFGTEEMLRRARKKGLSSLNFLLIDSAIIETTDQGRMLNALGVYNPVFGAPFQFQDVGIALAIQGKGALPTFDDLIARYDRKRELKLIKRMPDTKRRLFLQPTLDPLLASQLSDFFASCLSGAAETIIEES